MDGWQSQAWKGITIYRGGDWGGLKEQLAWIFEVHSKVQSATAACGAQIIT